ncbi:nascent polypeptide associated complex alpha chain with an NAC domain, putative [Perkinsus marinus ATCC 50983]|uniref:Nascent polypeptide associated complex alpha chain with an NAC domain, putative n=1 Tax=Perkinsus marinus (strain ATCC 50983 / TXsc) TaxID=423536 RepID=C5KWY8_PERM5|nr:nascent polypeptide associated complex alpha chain with an NAC domain, putative [Perkinsus marinus ATCC 50983]EER10992.1 nascent polypeptide associated complex alpha chain with an NAC domain, putative [Perkinsus marinus ATCC 50983]|eukprot:XP_002779197.1 nascent polypeptide associated complex alpha chain with an NAC domain, putative [Perkinsus marinus ATCC 50983]
MPIIEEVDGRVDSDDTSDDDEMPTLEATDEDYTQAAQDQHAAMRGKLNRAEKKARRAIQKLGLKPVPGIIRVTVRKGKEMLFVISQPDVLKVAGGDTYVVFGEARVEDMSAMSQAAAASQFTGMMPEVCKVDANPHPLVPGPVVEDDMDESDVDESGAEAKDVELVMGQVNCSRSKAVKALKAANNDIVEAIMQLSP